MIIENVVQMHASWLTVNAIQGCVNNCSYCYMKRFQATNLIPKRIMPHTDVIPYIKESRYYSPDIPICLFSGTDIMATKDNQEYLCQLLDEFERDTMTNPIILITKCKIPNEILRRIASINKKQHVIMYLSYWFVGSQH